MKNQYKNKKKVNYTIDALLLLDFNTICEKLAINKSKLINQLIKKWIDEKL